MTPIEKRAKELSAQVRGLSGAPKKHVYKTSVSHSYKYSSLLGKKAPWTSVRSPYVLSLSQKAKEIGKSKAPEIKVVEKTLYYGKPGEQGIKGERGEIGKSIVGPQGEKGERGLDGLTPVKGKHYFTPREIEEVVNIITKKVQKGIILPEMPAPVIQEVQLASEVDTEFVKKIIAIMHSLPENDKLEVSQGIRNAQSFIFGGTKYKTEELMHGAGSSSGGSSTPLTPIGTVNAVNAVFIVTARPSSVVADGITYFEGAGYSYSTLSVTLDVPPSQYIRYYL